MYLSSNVSIDYIYVYIHIHIQIQKDCTMYSCPFKPISISLHMLRSLARLSLAEHADLAAAPPCCLADAQAYQPRSTLLVDQKTWILYQDFSRGLNIVPIQNPMSTLKMALLSIILTVAHMIL